MTERNYATPESLWLEAQVARARADLGSVVLCPMRPSDTTEVMPPTAALQAWQVPGEVHDLPAGQVIGYRPDRHMVFAAALLSLSRSGGQEGEVGIHISGIQPSGGEYEPKIHLLQKAGVPLERVGRVALVAADGFRSQYDGAASAALPNLLHSGGPVDAALTIRVTRQHIGLPVHVVGGDLAEFRVVQEDAYDPVNASYMVASGV